MAVPLHKPAKKAKDWGPTQLIIFIVPLLALLFEVYKWKDEKQNG